MVCVICNDCQQNMKKTYFTRLDFPFTSLSNNALVAIERTTCWVGSSPPPPPPPPKGGFLWSLRHALNTWVQCYLQNVAFNITELCFNSWLDTECVESHLSPSKIFWLVFNKNTRLCLVKTMWIFKFKFKFKIFIVSTTTMYEIQQRPFWQCGLGPHCFYQFICWFFLIQFTGTETFQLAHFAYTRNWMYWFFQYHNLFVAYTCWWVYKSSEGVRHIASNSQNGPTMHFSHEISWMDGKTSNILTKLLWVCNFPQ